MEEEEELEDEDRGEDTTTHSLEDAIPWTTGSSSEKDATRHTVALLKKISHRQNRLKDITADKLVLRHLQKVTPHQPKPRISRTKGRASKRTTFVREIVKEVAGYVCFSFR